MLDLENPFYRPMWRRAVIVVGCLGWAGFELLKGSQIFAMLFGGIGLFCLYRFFVTYDPDTAPEEPSDRADKDDSASG